MNDHAAGPQTQGALAHQALFPIREVSRLTGVNAVTLRAWERRHGLIQPTRTDSGHRLYSQADIDTIRRIRGWLERGVAVSKVASILARGQASVQDVAVAEPSSRSQALLREAVQRFDTAALAQLFDQLSAAMALERAFTEVLMPVWHDLAAGQGAYGQASEWLFLDQFLRGRVFSHQQSHQQSPRKAQPRRLVLAPLPGPCQELELQVAGLMLGSEDVGVTLLMPGQPLDELALVCERLRPDALVLFANHALTAGMGKRLVRMAPSLQCPLLLAGEAAPLAQDSLAGTPVVCLGAEGAVMRQRLRQYLAGQLDT
ncbi:MerR family transcriptional regulator [Pantoea sp. Ap-967]|uniref:MerR family transcriptional regulator n=1 Tax=Pantoea sp. Ap-967 TaxID=2608362 RepID=UPI001422FC8D|nr:MerR family transcriptional regulator [Pantoea sp. Ap-967]NIE76453.1 MerR family transcriptional regulator [Pantoea sp. Ap-967]